MRRSRKLAALSAAALIVVIGCSDATDNSSNDLATHRARWSARGLTKYAYDYKITGFFINYAGHTIHLVVLNGVVRSARDVTAGQDAPGDPATWPTIDKLFDEAAQAAANGTLRGVRFDPSFDYPSQLDLAGPPDASGSVFASGLALLP